MVRWWDRCEGNMQKRRRNIIRAMASKRMNVVCGVHALWRQPSRRRRWLRRCAHAMLSVASFWLHVCVCVRAETDAAGRYTNPFALFQIKILLCLFCRSSFLFVFLSRCAMLCVCACVLRPLRLYCVHMKNAFASAREWNRLFLNFYLRSSEIFVGFSEELTRRVARLCFVAKMLCQRVYTLHITHTPHDTQQVRAQSDLWSTNFDVCSQHTPHHIVQCCTGSKLQACK